MKLNRGEIMCACLKEEKKKETKERWFFKKGKTGERKNELLYQSTYKKESSAETKPGYIDGCRVLDMPILQYCFQNFIEPFDKNESTCNTSRKFK